MSNAQILSIFKWRKISILSLSQFLLEEKSAGAMLSAQNSFSRDTINSSLFLSSHQIIISKLSIPSPTSISFRAITIPQKSFWRWSIAFQSIPVPASTSSQLSSEKLGSKGWSKRKKRPRRSTRRQSNKAEKQPMAILIPTARTSSTLRLEMFPLTNPSELRFHTSKSSACPAILSTRSM